MYIDAEKLKAQIQFLADSGYDKLQGNLYHILSIIESMEQEQQPTGLDGAPTSPDFDTEVYNWLREHGNDETRQLIEMTARHFWGMGRRDERMEMMKQGFTFEYTLIGRNTIENLDMDALRKAGIAFGNKVKVTIAKREEEQ